jgi:two-component system, NarL family, response regulator NreC
VDAGLDCLSRREQEVFRLLIVGHTNTEIASLLHISVRTVESHRANLQRKLALSTRAELVRFAMSRGLLAEAGA